MQKTLKTILASIAITTLFVVSILYWINTTIPSDVTIASGLPGGMYHKLGSYLKTSLLKQGVTVHLPETTGSLQNLHLLQSGDAQFAFYQPGTERVLAKHQTDPLSAIPANSTKDTISFVANLYPQVLTIIVHENSGIKTLSDIKGKRIALGSPESGDLAMSLALLDHINLSMDDLQARFISFDEAERDFSAERLDGIFTTLGIPSPILDQLSDNSKCRILDIPYGEVLAHKNLFFTPHTLEKGTFKANDNPIPSRDIQTVSVGAYLLCRSDTPTSLVELVTRELTSSNFKIDNQLKDILDGGSSYARLNLEEFPIHLGALNVYDPELRPLLNVDFVESMEGIRSFIVSILIALFLLGQWLKRRYTRLKEHKLDRYIRQLIKIEKKQMILDDDPESDDVILLQKYLDDITNLKTQALKEFSINELNEDRGIDCFIEMCFALTNKINAKMSRQRMEHRLSTIIKLLEAYATKSDESPN